jgi:hypothetical protein
MAFGLSAGAVALIGAGVGAAGSVISSKNAAKAAKNAAAGAEFSPVGIRGIGGSSATVGINRDGSERIQLKFGQDQEAIRDRLLADANLNAQGLGQDQVLAGQIQGATQDNILSDFGTLRGIGQNTGQESLLSAQNFARMGQQQDAFGQQGLNAAFGGPSAAGLTGIAQQQGQSLLNQPGPTSFNDLAGQRLSALRSAARPGEDRAVDSKLNNLFGSGRLGTTGGVRAIGELGLQQELADQNRIINSQDFANSQQNQERQFRQNQQGLGSQLLGQAFQGVGQDQSRGLGLGQLGAGQLNQRGATEAARLGAVQTGDQANLSQGQRRLASTQQLFGFGQALEDRTLDQTAQQVGITQTMDQNLLDQGRLSGSVGQAQASAGANAGALAMKGASSPFGAALQGLGSGLASSGGGSGGSNFFSGLFGGNSGSGQQLFNSQTGAPLQGPPQR